MSSILNTKRRATAAILDSQTVKTTDRCGP
jgi:putative transposase